MVQWAAMNADDSPSPAAPEFRSKAGRVYLVGAGPGDPGLLTLRGLECLRRADVVIYDYLANPRLLDFARPEAERACVGRHGRSRLWTQAEINARMIQAAQTGRVVVRLKGGDPAVFARAAEETDALTRALVPFEIVPGVTAGLAAGSYAGISLTHRDAASAVALVTGQEDEDKAGLTLDYAALARFPGTLVFYMGVTTAPTWAAALLAAGKPAETPVAVVRRCSLPDQRTLVCTLGDVAATLNAESRLRPPAIIIVGDVAADAARGSWFTQRPLAGQTVLVSRPLEQADALRRPLEELGAETWLQPAIEIGPPDDSRPLEDALSRLSEFRWIVFSSVNGVRSFCERLLASGRDMRALGTAKLAAVGPGTAEELRRYSLVADLVPATYRAESLAAELAETAAGASFLLVRASRGREVLAEMLAAAGGQITQVVAYRSGDVVAADPEVARRLSAGEIAWTTVTSSAIARSLVRLFGDSLRRTRLVSISPVTSATIRELGFEPAAEAEVYTMAGLVAALVKACGPAAAP